MIGLLTLWPYEAKIVWKQDWFNFEMFEAKIVICRKFKT